ncbi:Zn(2)-C6 fungal-type domain-containing protein [Mycena venus]|uniref:Zn(2)-C6 fungal-type domain-containing protein n=1 Tax=Mycena venus TaxID=2733690 RepID=A0A8H6YKF8_9AGAR|nr:Zn(2)-C6 fungal-type domain-containing protein [Mycena venus]
MSHVPEFNAVIVEMGERIRQLENAIASTQRTASYHPLWSTVTRPPKESIPAPETVVRGVSDLGDAVDLKLTYDKELTDSNEALCSTRRNCRFSPTSSQAKGASDSGPLESTRVSIAGITESFPFASDQNPKWDADVALEQLFTQLPPETRAWSLCEIYYRNGCWSGMPLVQSETVELLNLVYHGSDHHRPAATTMQMAVLFLIFALGSLVDLDLPANSSESDHYFDLAVAAMSIQSLFDDPTVVTVQALALLACYYTYGKFTVEGGWSVISMASSISERLNLHRDSLDSDRSQALFWETYSLESNYGHTLGHPTVTLLSNISCPYPPDEAPETQPFVKIFSGYRQARWAFTKEIVAPVLEAFFNDYETELRRDLEPGSQS